ncbi:MarR family transcriptional regulator [bacterium]|nr:MAG: MarR family transcriptional regulator [bacterium]
MEKKFTPDFVEQFFTEWKQSDPDSLFHDTNTAFLFRLMRCAQLLDQTLNAHCKAYSITHSQFQALAALRRKFPNSLTAAEIMEASVLTSGSVTTMIGELMKKGLVQKIKHPMDKRAISLTLTENGKELIETLIQIRLHEFKQITTEFGLENSQLLNEQLMKLSSVVIK